MATIAPNRETYGTNTVDLSVQKRKEWSDERIAYIKNHIEYANTHQIPVVNVFAKSLNQNGSGNIDLVNKTDYIHPSPKGVYFISQEIADFIYNNNLLGLNK